MVQFVIYKRSIQKLGVYMKFVIITILALLLGCSRNDVTIINSTEKPIAVHFMGERYELDTNQSQKIDDVIDGNFEYNAIPTLPTDADSIIENNLNGMLYFPSTYTSIILEFTSRRDTVVDDSTVTKIYSIRGISTSSASEHVSDSASTQ